MYEKNIFLVFTFFTFTFFSCKNSLYISYKAQNKSSYNVEFTLDGDYKTLNAGESFVEKRLDSATVELLNNVPVNFTSNYASVIFSDKTLQNITLSVKNNLSEAVVLDFSIENIGKVEVERLSEKTFTFSAIEVSSSDDVFSSLTIFLKSSPNYKVNFTLNKNADIYYILIN